MISSVNTQSLSMMQTSGRQMAPPPTNIDQNEQAQRKIESAEGAGSTRGAEGRPPPPPSPPPGGSSAGSKGGGQMGGADPAALIESLFETIEASDEETDENSLIETLSLIAAEGYETTQSLFNT